MRRTIRRIVVCFFIAAITLSLPSSVARAESSGVQSNRAQNAVLTLDRGWQFRQITSTPQGAEAGWLPATIPGDVHLDLLANKKIEDPFYRDNESKLQWIENASWEYRDSFDVTPALLARTNVDLVFDGLDAAAQVYLNGTQVLNADDSFRVWRVSPAKAHLHAGSNLLRIVFPSPITAAQLVAAADPWQPRTKTEPKTYIRKAAYEYGWDWGPRFVTSGIWRPARLEAWDKARIADFAIRQRDVSKAVAHVDAEVEVEASSSGPGSGQRASYSAERRSCNREPVVFMHAGTTSSTFPSRFASPSSGIRQDTAISRCTNSPRTSSPVITAEKRARPRPACAPSFSIAIWTSGADRLSWSSTASRSSPRART
jgi:beta-mannosidase